MPRPILLLTSSTPMYKCMERVLKGDAKTDFTQQANLVGSCTVGNFAMVIVTVPKETQENKNMYFHYQAQTATEQSSRMGQMFTTLPDDEVKEILRHATPNIWRREMTEQGYHC